MPRSDGQASAKSAPGAWLVTRLTSRPMKSGIVVSRAATMKPARKSATMSPRACRA